MYQRKSILFISVLLIVALSACNLPTEASEATATPDLAQTITALASGGQSSTPGAPSGSQETATPQFTATSELTATPSVPEVSVSVDTNCRVGPGVIYDRVGALTVGQKAQIVGKNSGVPNYWVIKQVNGSGTCWLWGEYATVSGNTANLTEYPVPPTPTPTASPTFTPTATLAPPAPVNNPTIAKVCIPLVAPTYNYTGVLNWEDKSDNETGFNIYFNGGLFATVPANSTSYALPPLPFALGTPAKWGVEAYNSAGKAGVKDVTMICP